MIQLSSQTWRGTQRERFPMTTVNTWRQEERKTLFSGWRIPKGMGEAFSQKCGFECRCVSDSLRFGVFVFKTAPCPSVSAGVYSDVTQTGPTPAMSAPTCRTRQPKSLCPGWRPAEAEETKLQLSSSGCCPLFFSLFFFFLLKTMQLLYFSQIRYVSQSVLHFSPVKTITFLFIKSSTGIQWLKQNVAKHTRLINMVEKNVWFFLPYYVIFFTHFVPINL